METALIVEVHKEGHILNSRKILQCKSVSIFLTHSHNVEKRGKRFRVRYFTYASVKQQCDDNSSFQHLTVYFPTEIEAANFLIEIRASIQRERLEYIKKGGLEVNTKWLQEKVTLGQLKQYMRCARSLNFYDCILTTADQIPIDPYFFGLWLGT